MIKDLKKQFFNFKQSDIMEQLVKWIIALGKIPLLHSSMDVRWSIYRRLENNLNFSKLKKENGSVSGSLVLKGSNFKCRVSDVYEDETLNGWASNGRDLFALHFEPQNLYNENPPPLFIFVFCRDNKVEISCIEECEDGKKIAKSLGFFEFVRDYSNDIMPVYVTWQKAYNLLCEIARHEHTSVPKCPTE